MRLALSRCIRLATVLVASAVLLPHAAAASTAYGTFASRAAFQAELNTPTTHQVDLGAPGVTPTDLGIATVSTFGCASAPTLVGSGSGTFLQVENSLLPGACAGGLKLSLASSDVYAIGFDLGAVHAPAGPITLTVTPTLDAGAPLYTGTDPQVYTLPEGFPASGGFFGVIVKPTFGFTGGTATYVTDVTISTSDEVTIGLGNIEYANIDDFAPVPEPSTIALAATGLLGVAALARRRARG